MNLLPQIVFYNPHVDDFVGEPPHFKILRRRPLKKYGFVLECSLAQDCEISAVVDGTVSAFIPDGLFSRFPFFLRKIVAKVEFTYWKHINQYGRQISLVDFNRSIPSSQVLFLFSYKCAVGRLFEERKRAFSAFSCVIAHLSHYFISTAEKSKNLSTIPNIWLGGDSDITNNPYFKRHFYWYGKQFLVLPFAVSPRFKDKRRFADRTRRCIATGTFHNLDVELPRYKYWDYLDFFKTNTYHPIRKQIFERVVHEGDLIVSLISPFRVFRGAGTYWNLLSHFFVGQKRYFNVDIVDTYNSYQFAVVGEELSGFPALGAFEAMACGCVLVADENFYQGLGLRKGIDYVAHKGSIASIEDCVRSILNSPDGGESIANGGMHFINSRLRPKDVFLIWLMNIKKLYKPLSAQ